MEVQVRLLRPEDRQRLADFFEQIAADDTASMFHPHPLTSQYAAELTVRREGQDQYFIADHAGRVLGYGMLRGWDEGYAVPAFGVAVLSEMRGRGIGRQLLRYALDRAKRKGAQEVMLKVHPDNIGARRLYESEGFEFHELAEDGVQLKGMRRL